MLTLPYTVLAVAIACTACYGAGRWQQYRADETSHQAAKLHAVEAARAEFQRVLENQHEAVRHATKAADAARVETRLAVDAAGQLRQRIAALRAKHPAPTAGSAPADDPIGVLADVLARADTRAGILAEYADQARIAGELCVSAYEALRGGAPSDR